MTVGFKPGEVSNIEDVQTEQGPRSGFLLSCRSLGKERKGLRNKGCAGLFNQRSA